MTLFLASGTAAGVGNATVSASLRAAGAATIAGLGLPVFGPHVGHHAAAAVQGAAIPNFTAHRVHLVTLTLPGVAHSTFLGEVTHNARASLPGAAGTSLSSQATQRAAATLVGAATFTVDHFIASASIAGSSQVNAAVREQLSATAPLSGAANIAPTARVIHEATAHLAGSSSLSVPLYYFSGVAAGAGTATATAALRAAAKADGVGAGTASLGPGKRTHWSNALLTGAASLLATSPARHIILGGRTSGVGGLSDNLLSLASGLAPGAGTVTASGFRLVLTSGIASGHSGLAFSEPLPLIGVGNIVAFAQILTYPPPYCRPICGCENCCGRREEDCDRCEVFHRRFHETGQQPAPGGPSDCDHYRHCERPCWWQCRECWWRHAEHRRFEEEERHRHGHHDEHEWSKHPNPEGRIGEFRWNQTFGKGDLEICIKDRFGNQRGPVFIGYTMFTVTSTGIMHQVGPTDRKPAQADVGKFYVTGTAGENGQPGCWAVRWRYQRTYSDAIIEQVQQFRVLDAVLDCDRPDHVRRHCKYGWDL